ncbi:hypothetical protein GOD35_07250 [Sinorhizobium medicae]|nr:hypothetical protein [Sinorhizobium medicae]MDX0519547.1 hypothetical protein [Sinorhizobium medicae]MDX0544346.1 hypothetical protein [Sinorhizobium medicae]MDX0632047.1 hypothetical protein [Sinorhizobium medicae]MDX0770374.1 hypothetical protein [Sinorhizobium medicae]
MADPPGRDHRGAAGLVMTTLTFFVGDADPLLMRVPGTDLRSPATDVMAL